MVYLVFYLYDKNSFLSGRAWCDLIMHPISEEENRKMHPGVDCLIKKPPSDPSSQPPRRYKIITGVTIQYPPVSRLLPGEGVKNLPDSIGAALVPA